MKASILSPIKLLETYRSYLCAEEKEANEMNLIIKINMSLKELGD
jgi:hypothetical protein